MGSGQQLEDGTEVTDNFQPTKMGNTNHTPGVNAGIEGGGIERFAEGGLIPVDILGGLKEAIVDPITNDWKQGNRAIKQVRDQHPTVDNLAGIHPYIAAAQVMNDVAAGQLDGGTAINVAQSIPMVKGLTGMQKMLSKEIGPTIGGKNTLSICRQR